MASTLNNSNFILLCNNFFFLATKYAGRRKHLIVGGWGRKQSEFDLCQLVLHIYRVINSWKSTILMFYINFIGFVNFFQNLVSVIFSQTETKAEEAEKRASLAEKMVQLQNNMKKPVSRCSVPFLELISSLSCLPLLFICRIIMTSPQFRRDKGDDFCNKVQEVLGKDVNLCQKTLSVQCLKCC